MTDGRGVALGILGGTFNPPHLGHLAVACRALLQLELARVLLMPAAIPPHKRAEEDPGGEHRLQMCRLLIADTPGLSACSVELERGGPSYTIDTLRVIQSSHPEAKLTFIVGADIAGTLPRWREAAALFELADIAVAPRAGLARREVLGTVAALLDDDGAGRAITERVRFLEMGNVEVSSSMVRAQLARGQPVAALVGPAVAAYIEEHALYRASVGAAS